MSGRLRFPALLAVVGLAVAAPAGAVEWSFRPDAEVAQTYTSNAQRSTAGSESDLITLLRANLPVAARGRAGAFELAYWPTYEYFWNDNGLSALSHLARFSWSREGTRVRASTLATYQRSEDPRLSGPRPGEPASPEAPTSTPFLVERSRTTLADLTAMLGFTLSPANRIETSAWLREQGYSAPELIDTDEVGGTVGFVSESSPRQRWNGQLRVTRFSSAELGSQAVAIVEGGGGFELHRGLRLTARLGGIVGASGGVLGELSAGDQILGAMALAGQARSVRWSAGVKRDVAAGGGLRVAVLDGEAMADLAVTLGARDTMGISASRSHSRQPVESGSTLDLTSDQIALSAQHRFGAAWSASFEAARLQQESDAAGAAGTFSDDRVAIGVRWVGTAAVSR